MIKRNQKRSVQSSIMDVSGLSPDSPASHCHVALQCMAVGSINAQPATVVHGAAAAAAAQEPLALKQQQQGQPPAQPPQGQQSQHHHGGTGQQSSGQCSATGAVLPDEQKPAGVLPGPVCSANSGREQLAGSSAAGHQAGQPHDKYVLSSDFVSSSTDPWQRLLDWMRHNGAIVREATCTCPCVQTLGICHTMSTS